LQPKNWRNQLCDGNTVDAEVKRIVRALQTDLNGTDDAGERDRSIQAGVSICPACCEEKICPLTIRQASAEAIRGSERFCALAVKSC
jgi:hypothetical protein